MSSGPDPPSSPSHPPLHLGRSQLNAAAVDHSENNQNSGPSSGDPASFSSSVPGYSHSREKAEKNGKYESNFYAELAYIKHWILLCICVFQILFKETLLSRKIKFSNFS